MHYEKHTFRLDKLTDEHVIVDDIYVADELTLRNTTKAHEAIAKLSAGHYKGIITYEVRGRIKFIHKIEFKKITTYYVYRVGLDDEGEFLQVFDDLEAAKQFREFCYAEDERTRANGEYTPFYRYVITDSE